MNKDLFRLGHILDSIEKIEYLVRMLHTQDNFESKWIEQDAIIRNLEIIGEATVNISDDLKQCYPDVSWKEIRGMRNVVIKNISARYRTPSARYRALFQKAKMLIHT